MTALGELLEGNRVLDLGPLPAPRLTERATLEQAVQFLVRGRRGAIVIVDGNVPVGIFTERDVLFRADDAAFVSRDHLRRTALSEIMSRSPVTIRRQASLHDAVTTMSGGGFRHLIVTDRKGELRGLLNTNDIVQFLTDQFPEEMINLPPRLHQQYGRPEGA